MSAFVVDTNVAVVANGQSPQADPDCVTACIEALEEIYDRAIIVLDDEMRILDEYRRANLNLSGQPGAGDFFLKWVWIEQANADRCERVHLTESDCHPCGFLEAPNDPELANFDPSDRKFVAVANASRHRAQVLNAVDSDWAQHHVALVRNGINVKFLCPQHVCPRI